MKKTTKKSKGARRKEILDYDDQETSLMIDASKPLKFEDLGFRLPDQPPTQVISIRLPSRLLNKIKSIGSQRDIPYQALIKYYLANAIERTR